MAKGSTRQLTVQSYVISRQSISMRQLTVQSYVILRQSLIYQFGFGSTDDMPFFLFMQWLGAA